jgi:hypothetical protein
VGRRAGRDPLHDRQAAGSPAPAGADPRRGSGRCARAGRSGAGARRSGARAAAEPAAEPAAAPPTEPAPEPAPLPPVDAGLEPGDSPEVARVKEQIAADRERVKQLLAEPGADGGTLAGNAELRETGERLARKQAELEGLRSESTP